MRHASPHLSTTWRRTAMHKVGAALLFWAACDQPITNVELERTQETKIDGISGPWQSLELRDFPVLTMHVEPPEAARGNVGDVMLRRLYLEVVEPAEMNLSFADAAVVYVEAEGFERVPVAEVARIIPDSSVVEFDALEVDLTPYVEAEELTLTVALDGQPPPEDVTLRVHVVLDVGVTSDAACEAITTQSVR